MTNNIPYEAELNLLHFIHIYLFATFHTHILICYISYTYTYLLHFIHIYLLCIIDNKKGFLRCYWLTKSVCGCYNGPATRCVIQCFNSAPPPPFPFRSFWKTLGIFPCSCLIPDRNLKTIGWDVIIWKQSRRKIVIRRKETCEMP